ncbi:MAG TPA: efflux RND transporter periplasmic adaptor subunit [Anaeromyxobacteraceae bacterium]|nr:efflux RND transporter periplasmic adaptor subunit [Anaeromyxobacteraceae bacterium]
MSWTKRIIAAVFVLAVAGIVAASLAPKKDPPVAVQTTSVRKGPITRKVAAAGKLQAATQVKLSSNLSGDLLDLPVREGDVIKKGQYIGRIDSRRYEAQLHQREAMEQSARSELTTEEVNLARLDADVKRVERLVKADSASAAELEKIVAERDGAAARVQAAKDRVRSATASLNEARYLLSFTTLTAPIDGILTSRLKQVGERVRGSDFNEDPIVIIATLSSMEMKVEVGEHEVVHLHEGDPAEIEIDAFPDQKFPAQVIEIAKNATVKNAGTEAEVTTFPVRIALTAKVPGALPGMSGQATISTETRDQALIVPLQAVTVRSEKQLAQGKEQKDGPPPEEGAGVKKTVREAQQKVVFVVEDGKARVRRVETGLASENDVELVSGVKEGEVIVEGPYKLLSRDLADGKPVKDESAGKGKEKAKDAPKVSGDAKPKKEASGS